MSEHRHAHIKILHPMGLKNCQLELEKKMGIHNVISKPTPIELHKLYRRRRDELLPGSANNIGGGIRKKRHAVVLSLDLVWETHTDFVLTVVGKMTVLSNGMDTAKGRNETNRNAVDDILRRIDELSELPLEVVEDRISKIESDLNFERIMHDFSKTDATFREMTWDATVYILISVRASFIEFLKRGDEQVVRALLGVILRTVGGMVPWAGPLILGLKEINDAVKTRPRRFAEANAVEVELEEYGLLGHRWSAFVEIIIQIFDAKQSTTQKEIHLAAQSALQARRKRIVDWYNSSDT